MTIERTFKDITEGTLSEAAQQYFWLSLGWANGSNWQALLLSKRVLIISEAGSGKTYECHAQHRTLWDKGEPAFFLELALLAVGDLRSLLSDEEEARLDAWLVSQSDVATFFLDSIDELNLTRNSFEQALKRLNKGIRGQLGRARIVITARPVPFDEGLVRRELAMPPLAIAKADGETFAQTAMSGRSDGSESRSDDTPAEWRTVALLPFSDEQILEFAGSQGVEDPSAMLQDLERRNAQEFACRPQELIEVCAGWRDSPGSIRTHRQQVATSIRCKLSPREDRGELAPLSIDKAIEGASRLALALTFTRRLTIRHSAKADTVSPGIAVDPKTILSDWTAEERKTLLERSLFGFASYGRVRFDHRSVFEYLAAERIKTLRKKGMRRSALKRLIFSDTRGMTIVRPS